MSELSIFFLYSSLPDYKKEIYQKWLKLFFIEKELISNFSITQTNNPDLFISQWARENRHTNPNKILFINLDNAPSVPDKEFNIEFLFDSKKNMAFKNEIDKEDQTWYMFLLADVKNPSDFSNSFFNHISGNFRQGE